MGLFKMCWRRFFPFLFLFLFLNSCLFLALLPAFMWRCLNSLVDVLMCCAVALPVALSCGSRWGLWCFDATSRAYLKARFQEHWIRRVFASAFLVPHSPLKAATQEYCHSLWDTECSHAQRKDSIEPKNSFSEAKTKQYWLRQVAGLSVEVNR